MMNTVFEPTWKLVLLVKNPAGKGPPTNSGLKKDGNTATVAEQDEVVAATGSTSGPVVVVNELLSYYVIIATVAIRWPLQESCVAIILRWKSLLLRSS